MFLIFLVAYIFIPGLIKFITVNACYFLAIGVIEFVAGVKYGIIQLSEVKEKASGPLNSIVTALKNLLRVTLGIVIGLGVFSITAFAICAPLSGNFIMDVLESRIFILISFYYWVFKSVRFIYRILTTETIFGKELVRAYRFLQ